MTAETTSTQPAPAGEPEAPSAPSDGAPGSSVSGEEDAPAGSPAAPKSGSTQAGEHQA